MFVTQVNCSMNSSGFQLCRFRQIKATMNQELQVGDGVRFSHSVGGTETDTYLILKQEHTQESTEVNVMFQVTFGASHRA